MQIDVFQLGRRIAAQRELRDMTQKALANATGLTQATIARVERGQKKRVELNTIAQIAHALGVGLDDLLKPIEERDPV
jgi:transcriptional regulator with XRE-family HTH domain